MSGPHDLVALGVVASACGIGAGTALMIAAFFPGVVVFGGPLFTAGSCLAVLTALVASESR